MKRRSLWNRFARFFIIAVVLAAAFYGGSILWKSWSDNRAAITEPTGKPLAMATVGDLTATLYGELRFAPSELLIEFRDANGEPVDAGKVKLELDMNMPGMTMHSAGETASAGKPGQYHVKIKPDMAGDWVAKLSIDGLRGKAQASFPVNVKP